MHLTPAPVKRLAQHWVRRYRRIHAPSRWLHDFKAHTYELKADTLNTWCN